MSNEQDVDSLKKMLEKMKDIVDETVKEITEDPDLKDKSWSHDGGNETKSSWDQLGFGALLNEAFDQVSSEVESIVNTVDKEMSKGKFMKTLQGVPTYKFALREDLKEDKQFLPSRANSTDTGWDVRVATEDHKDLILYEGQKVMIPLGFRAFCQQGWWLKMNPRSSTFAKKHLNCLYGVVDQDYHGFVYLCVQFQPPENYNEYGLYDSYEYIDKSVNRPLGNPVQRKQIVLPFGDKIGQLIPVKREEMMVEEVSNEEYNELCEQRDGTRGSGGFGSSGN